jgi:TonB family protein
MGLENEVGVYESADVEAALAERMDEVRGCYRRAGRAQRYAGGTVTLRFAVQGDGTTEDVLVIGTDLGNYEVERCLVGVGRTVKFPAPNGNKATTFEYPVEFRSTHELQVLDLDESIKIEHDMAVSMHLLAGCGPVSETGASAIFYVEPSGAIGSVGLATSSPVNEEAAACTVREMRRWRMSATLPGRMLRYHANLPAMIASAEPRRTPPLTVASRRRRR